MLFEDAAFWERAWYEERALSLYGRQIKERAGQEWWNRRAARYAARIDAARAQKQAAELLHYLGHHDALRPDMEILDIGCGPGTNALSLARRAKRVVALDPSEAMLAILQEQAAAGGITNVETVCLPWEEVNLAEYGWEKRFDLVIAAMTPGIKDVPSLQKMLAASRGGCFYSGFIRRHEAAPAELWRQFFGEDIPPLAGDVLYIFHLLLAWGYLPSLEFERRSTRQPVPVAEAAGELEEFFHPYLELTPEIQEKIRAYVEARAGDGQFTRQTDSLSGQLFWMA